MKIFILILALFICGCDDLPIEPSIEITVDHDEFDVINSTEISKQHMDVLRWISAKYGIDAILIKHSTETLSNLATYYMFVSSHPFTVKYTGEE